MAIDTSMALGEELARLKLLDAAQLGQLARLQRGDPRSLARELVQRGWLTPYQVNQLFQGNGKDLVLGQYILLERLGEGGMGQVFKARHAKLGKIVALKVIRKDRLADPEAVSRFRREMQAVAQLAHPNVVAALDAEQAGDAHFLVMEYVEGIDLGRLVKEQGPLPVAQACEYIRQAALGLQHAHEKGLVHRDIKPSNLLVQSAERGAHSAADNLPALSAPRSALGVVKILDLGLARLHQPGGEEPSALTQIGVVVGTPDYMSPEQARNSSRADIRSDLYSLGCTFYYLLAGQVPFSGVTGTEKLLKQCFETAPPLAKLRPDVSPRVCKIVEKLMAKNPDDRYQTPAKLVVALSRPGLLSGTIRKPLTKFLLGVLGKDPPIRPDAPERLRKAADRRRWQRLNIVGGALLIVLLVTFGVLLWAKSGRTGTTVTALAPPTRAVRVPADQLDAKSIPPSEQFAKQPKELVAVLGKQVNRPRFEARTVAFAGDGRTLATGGARGRVRLWDLGGAEPTERALLEGNGRSVSTLRFSPDGKLLAAAGQDLTLRIYDVASGRPVEIAKFSDFTQAPTALAFAGDGSLLACGSLDRTVRLYEVAGDAIRPRGEPLVHADTVVGLAFDGRGHTLACLVGDSLRAPLLQLWDIPAGKPQVRAELRMPKEFWSAIALAPDGHTLVAGTDRGTLHMWDIAASVRDLGEWTGSTVAGPVHALAYAPDGAILAQSLPGRLVIWDVAAMKTSRDWPLPTTVEDLAFGPEGRHLAAAYANGTVGIFRLAPPR